MNTQQQIAAIRSMINTYESSRRSVALSGDTNALKAVDATISKLNAKFLALCASK